MSVNLSSTGVALRSPDLVNFRSVVVLSFTPPGMSHPIETKAQMAWIDNEGRAGFRFLHMPEETARELEQWLSHHIETEGWTAEMGLSQHL